MSEERLDRWNTEEMLRVAAWLGVLWVMLNHE